jgi:hypothetical protein
MILNFKFLLDQLINRKFTLFMKNVTISWKISLKKRLFLNEYCNQISIALVNYKEFKNQNFD